MTLPRKRSRKQAPRTTPTVDLALTVPDNDPGPGPDRCPSCGRPWFDAKASGLIDMITLAQDVLTDLKAGLEDGVRP